MKSIVSIIAILFFACSCMPKSNKSAASMEAMIKVGMTRAEVIRILGESHIPEDDDDNKSGYRRRYSSLVYNGNDGKSLFVVMRDGVVRETKVSQVPTGPPDVVPE